MQRLHLYKNYWLGGIFVSAGSRLLTRRYRRTGKHYYSHPLISLGVAINRWLSYRAAERQFRKMVEDETQA
jgi:hypothetical protein